MKLTTEDRGGVLVVKCEGALSAGVAVKEFDAACKTWIGRGRGIVLDLSRATYVDSTGIATVVSCVKRTAEKGPTLKLVLATEGATRRAFAITQLDQVLDVFEDVEAAVASCP